MKVDQVSSACLLPEPDAALASTSPEDTSTLTAGGSPASVVFALRVLLALLGTLMVIASRVSGRLRRQITRDVRVELSSDDGVAQAFVFRARTRTMKLERGGPGAPEPDVALRFPDAREAIATLLHPQAIGKVMHSMNLGGARIDGDGRLVVWFYGLTRVVLPIGRQRLPRRPIPAPVRAGHHAEAAWSQRVTREPPIDVLDPALAEAWAARGKVLQVRATVGQPLPRG